MIFYRLTDFKRIYRFSDFANLEPKRTEFNRILNFISFGWSVCLGRGLLQLVCFRWLRKRYRARGSQNGSGTSSPFQTQKMSFVQTLAHPTVSTHWFLELGRPGWLGLLILEIDQKYVFRVSILQFSDFNRFSASRARSKYPARRAANGMAAQLEHLFAPPVKWTAQNGKRWLAAVGSIPRKSRKLKKNMNIQKIQEIQKFQRIHEIQENDGICLV